MKYQDMAAQLAAATGSTPDEAQREIEDAGVARLDSIARHEICRACGSFRGEHLAGEGFHESCVFGD